MQDGATDEQMPVEGVEPLRPREARLERVSYRPASHPDAQRRCGAEAQTDMGWTPREWERVFDAAGDAIFLTDREFRIARANRATSQILGKPLDEILGKTYAQAIHGTDQPPETCPLAQAHHTKAHVQGEIYVSQRAVWLEVSVDPMLDENGDVTGVLHILRDVTDGKKMKEAMRESEEKYRNLFENAREAILLIDVTGNITAVNQMVADYGFKRDELVGQRLFDFVVEDHRAKAIADFKVLLGGEPVKGEMDVITPKGVFSVEYKDNPIRRDGQIVGIQAILTDVTKRKRAEQLLRKERDKAQNYLDIAGVMLVVIDSEQRVGLINKRGCEVLGYAEEEVLGKNWFDQFLPDAVRNEVKAAFQGILRGEMRSLECYRNPVLTRTGEERQIIWHNAVLREDNGEVVAILSSGEDVTERRWAEEALRKSESRYRLLADNASDVIWTTDLSLQLTYCSPSVERMLGYAANEMLTKRASETLTPASRELIGRIFADETEAERTGQGDPLRSRMVEVEEVRKDGTTLWVEVRAGFLRDADGKAVGIVGVTRDISERKRLEHEIVMRERYLNSFFTGATAGLALLDKDMRYIQINDTLAEMNGVPAKDHLSKTLQEIVPELAPAVEPILRKVLDTGESVLNVEVTGQRRDQLGIQRHWVESFFPIAGADGTPEAVGAIVVEITERKRVEQQLLDYQARLRELAAELTLAEERERRRIAVGVHDQIGQRLALTKLTLQSLAAASPEQKVSTILNEASEEIEKVIEEAHSLTFELSNPVLYEVGFEGAVESWLMRQVQERHGIECMFATGLHPLRLDQETSVTLFHVVRELLTNVIKHAKAKHADVRIHKIGETVQITVRDDGIGFQPAQNGHIVSKSGGFGLFNVQEKLDYLGGSVKIESEPGKGSCIVVVAPLREVRNTREGDCRHEDPDRR